MANGIKFGRLWVSLQMSILQQIHRMPLRSMAPHLAVGIRGERIALLELRRRGYIVVARRWTSPKMRGDVDLIAWHGERLCFIEVKTRTSRGITPAETAVDDTKRRMLRGLARIYLKSFPEGQRRTLLVRFDVVSVYPGRKATDFEIFPGAFSWA